MTRVSDRVRRGGGQLDGEHAAQRVTDHHRSGETPRANIGEQRVAGGVEERALEARAAGEAAERHGMAFVPGGEVGDGLAP